MKFFITTMVLCLGLLPLGACAVFGDSGVKIAPYAVLEQDKNFELRHYESMVLVSTPMVGGMNNQNGAFGKLFKYITGDNNGVQDIAMTAPVFMEQTAKNSETMSFVLPADFTIETAPTPQSADVTLEEMTDYTVAAVRFSGTLKQDNIDEHKALLEDWIAQKGYTKTGGVKAAGYNPPFTLPAYRRNEVLIAVEKP